MNAKYISYIKYACYIAIFLLVCFWRPNKKDISQQEENVKNSAIENTTKISTIIDNPCDENKIKDFKNNLTKSPNPLSQKNIQKIDKATKEYMTQYCAAEPTLCKSFDNKYHELYNTINTEIQLGLSAYVLENAIIDDTLGANIKVLSIIEKGDMVQYFIFDDLIGEILVELSGFEGNLSQFSIWGSAFPYFVEQYGKFKITNNNATFSIVYECQVN